MQPRWNKHLFLLKPLYYRSYIIINLFSDLTIQTIIRCEIGCYKKIETNDPIRAPFFVRGKEP